MDELTRRAFLGRALSAAVWPAAGAFAASPHGGVDGRWEKADGTATDSVLVRRLYLDLAGRLPTLEEAQSYVRSAEPDKRTRLVDLLLGSDDFADYWTMRFCDALRVKSEFPINLWPNAVYVYHRRIRAFVADDEPWDAFGRALLTAQGSNFRDAEANFFRAVVQRTPEGWAEAVAQTFLGIPPGKLKPERRARLEAHFKTLRIKTTGEWKEEIVYADAPDRRGELADRLFAAQREETARAFRRRLQKAIYGPKAVDDGIGVDFRLKPTLRAMLLAPAYARGSVTGGFPARRLDAETLEDAFFALSGDRRKLESPAPEPFTFLPGDRRTVCVEDGSITDAFLTLFGRPARDTGLAGERDGDVTAKRRLYLFNSARLHGQLARMIWPVGADGKPIKRKPPTPFAEQLDQLYWRLLARPVAPDERKAIAAAMRAHKKFNLRDVAWCVVNSMEFIYRT